jgi:pimeloyl-ACP methyl ester carboxylesterase
MPHTEARDGTNLYYKIWGTGRPIVLLHGWPLSADSWDDQAIALVEAGYQVVAYDRRGFGRSDQPGSGYDYDTLADDLADIITATKLRDATIAGFSMGGGEVARYMSRHGGKNVARAVLISSIVPYMLKTSDNPNGVPPDIFAEMEHQMRTDRAAFFTSFFSDFYGVGLISSPVSDEVLEWSRNVAMQAGLNATLACAKAFATTDFRPDLKSITVPTLIIHGTADKTVPIDTSARAAAKGIAHAELVEIPDGPHGLLATHKREISQLLIDFHGQEMMAKPKRARA